MPRRKKCRKVCSMPNITYFTPVGRRCGSIVLTVDEYECIRLIDKHGFSQLECSKYMQVARTTVQSMYDTARKKIATALVDGLGIKIDGGDYRLCDGAGEHRECRNCPRHCKRGAGI